MKQTRIETTRYYAPPGGLPAQTELHTGRAVFTEAYAVIPKGVFSDIVTSYLPHWDDTRAWIIARPLTGFAETFSQYVMEVAPGGGSDRPEPDAGAEGVLFVTEGELALTLAGKPHTLDPGRLRLHPARLPRGACATPATAPARFHWIRKAYEPVDGLPAPDPLVLNEQEIAPAEMPDTEGRWATTRFVDPADLRHDMHVTVVTFQPGGVIPFEETHVMEHGLYVLEGKAVYRLNRDWVEVEAGDFMWLRAFCPQACYAGGPGRFRYLLYKDVNRHPRAAARSVSMDTLSRTLIAEPLTAEAFAPWGDVIEAAGRELPDQRRHVRPLPRPRPDGVHRRGRAGRDQHRLGPALSAAARLPAGRAPPARQPGLRADDRGAVPRRRRAGRGRPARGAARVHHRRRGRGSTTCATSGTGC